MRFRTGDAFREAVGRGEFDTADRLLIELREEVTRAWPAIGPAERATAATEILALLDWGRKTVLARRSQAQLKLARIRRGGVYVAAGLERRRHVEIEA